MWHIITNVGVISSNHPSDIDQNEVTFPNKLQYYGQILYLQVSYNPMKIFHYKKKKMN